MFAWIFGILGVIVNMMIFQQKDGKKLLIFKLLSDLLWSLHYLCIAAYSASLIAAVNIFRELVFIYQDKKGKKSNGFLIIFLCAGIVTAALTWNGFGSILPTLVAALSTFSFWQSNPKLSRRLAFPISGCMMTYDIISGSVIGIFNEGFAISSAIIGIIREKKTEKEIHA